MATRPLRLKSEVIQSVPLLPSTGPTVADVWVDAGVYHLDSIFSYAISEKLQGSIHQGSFVLVPFNGREVTAVVVSLRSADEKSNLKFITKVLGDLPQLLPQVLELIELASARYAAHPFDLIRSAVPSRVVGIEKDFSFSSSPSKREIKNPKRQYLQLPPARSKFTLIAEKAVQSQSQGGVLVVLPDTRAVKELERELTSLAVTPTILDSDMGKSEVYRAFLQIRTGQSQMVIGTRSAIFAPVENLATIIVYNEGSEHFYEQRSPGWNVRDIALLRHHAQPLNLLFIGYNPSTEIARLIDEEWIEFRRSKAKVSVFAESPTHGELLPSRSLGRIKKLLQQGPVLFLVPQKGYAQAIRCGKCRTISKCECGGSHQKTSATAPIVCVHCLKAELEWRCSWCGSVVPSLMSRGIDRHAHELGALFPGVAVHVSTADHLHSDVIEAGIVIATPGVAPTAKTGYSAVVILEADRFLSQPDMRAQERVREMFFSHAALISSQGEVIFVGDTSHPIITSLTSWNPSMAIHQELQERSELHLPPYSRVVIFTMETVEVVRFKNALLKAHEDGLVPQSTSILGPVPRGDKSSLILSTSVGDGDSLVTTLHEFMRRRSASKKSLPRMRIDPYSLSH